MKNILFLLLFITATVTAQNTRGKANDAGRIVLNTFIEDLEGVPAGALKMLKTNFFFYKTPFIVKKKSLIGCLKII